MGRTEEEADSTVVGLGFGRVARRVKRVKQGQAGAKGRKEGWPRDPFRLACRQEPEALILTALAWRWHEAGLSVNLASAVEPSCPALVEAQAQTTSQLTQPSQPTNLPALPCPALPLH